MDEPLREDTVSERHLGLFVEGAGLGAVALAAGTPCEEGEAGCRLQHQAIFDTFMGFVLAFAATYTVTEAVKYGVGRLRPDFLARWERFACAADPDANDCVRPQPNVAADSGTGAVVRLHAHAPRPTPHPRLTSTPHVHAPRLTSPCAPTRRQPALRRAPDAVGGHGLTDRALRTERPALGR